MNNEDNCKFELEKYKITLDFLKFEATTLWQIFSAFFVAHAIFISFVLTVLANNNTDKIKFVLLLIASIVGLILAIIWLGTFIGNSDWYYFRMAQAKNAEKIFINWSKDDKWYLLNKEAFRFVKGKEIYMEMEKTDKLKTKFEEDKFPIMSPIGRIIKNKYAGNIMISIFIVIYILIIGWSIYNI